MNATLDIKDSLAIYFFRESLKYNPNDSAVHNEIERAKKRLEYLEKFNVQEKIEYVFDLIRHEERVPSTFLKRLEGTDKLYEVRVKVGSNIYRIFCQRYSFIHANEDYRAGLGGYNKHQH